MRDTWGHWWQGEDPASEIPIGTPNPYYKRPDVTILCDRCGKELKELGGLLLSPPEEDGRVLKQHLCVACYVDIRAWCMPGRGAHAR